MYSAISRVRRFTRCVQLGLHSEYRSRPFRLHGYASARDRSRACRPVVTAHSNLPPHRRSFSVRPPPKTRQTFGSPARLNVGDQCNSQGCDRVAFANCENFVHLIFDRIGGRRSAGATGRRGHHRRWGLQPSTLSECRKIDSRWSIPSTGAIAGAKLQSDILVAIRNP